MHKSGQTTPVLLRDHVHAHDPATPPPSDGDSKKTTGEAELNLDLQELGLEDSVIRPDLLVKLERIGSGGFKECVHGLRGNNGDIRWIVVADETQCLCRQIQEPQSGHFRVQRTPLRE